MNAHLNLALPFCLDALQPLTHSHPPHSAHRSLHFSAAHDAHAQGHSAHMVSSLRQRATALACCVRCSANLSASLLPLVAQLTRQAACSRLGCVPFCSRSDVAVKEYLVWLDQSGALGAPFVLREVDDEHLFVVADRPNLFQTLQEYLDAWHDVSHSSKHNTRRAQERNAVRVCFRSLRPCASVTARCCSSLCRLLLCAVHLSACLSVLRRTASVPHSNRRSPPRNNRRAKRICHRQHKGNGRRSNCR
jgi:TFIIH basal transcription factor complex TTD-A subunit